jgi:DDE_Tnp_1-associated
MPAQSYLPSLMAALSQVADPRQRRGVRHPFSAILALTLLGLVCRLNDFAALRRWAARNWHLVRRPLGFRRGKPPHPTTLSRTLAKFSLEDFQIAFSRWLQEVVTDRDALVVAVDGKTSKQGFDPQGDPIQMLNVFAQDLKACLGQWPLCGDKSTEPEVLKAHLSELFEKYPALRLITGDALYAQRNLAELIHVSGHDYMFQIKANQPDILDAAQTCFAQAEDRKADAHTREKKGATEKLVFFGSTWTTPFMSAKGWVLPVAACCCESTDTQKTVAAKARAKRGTSSPASTRKASRRNSSSNTCEAIGK